MFSDIDEAVAWVTARRSRHQGFAKFAQAMAEAGDPQDAVKTIHVAGTNGKGSTVNDLKDILQSQGWRVGMYTSPHLVNHRDRIRLADHWIEPETFLQYLNAWLPFIEQHDLSMFEIDTLIAALYYRDQKADWAVIETGLGGRLDSTNVLHHPALEVITTISFDHMERLGNTLAAIAGEKAGIIKAHSRVVTGYLPSEAMSVIRRQAADMQAELIQTPAYTDLGPQAFRLANQTYQLSTAAQYQKANASTALWAARQLGIDITSQTVHQAIARSSWPGRFETAGSHPLVILDGAHNIEGMQALCASLTGLPRPLIAVFSALKDKPGPAMAKMLADCCDSVFITQFENSRADTAQRLAAGQAGQVFASWQQALTAAQQQAGRDGTVLVAGSLYLISEVRAYLQTQNNSQQG